MVQDCACTANRPRRRLRHQDLRAPREAFNLARGSHEQGCRSKSETWPLLVDVARNRGPRSRSGAALCKKSTFTARPDQAKINKPNAAGRKRHTATCRAKHSLQTAAAFASAVKRETATPVVCVEPQKSSPSPSPSASESRPSACQGHVLGHGHRPQATPPNPADARSPAATTCLGGSKPSCWDP